MVEGNCKYTNGDYYQGQFEWYNRHGYGKMVYCKDGSSWEGEWRSDKREGKGILTLADGSKQEGTWVDDELQK
ncbi:hypothetical protein FGO68_gene7319 [Halteria grandinella]|uniref:MORN repeat protein n=1 Tax=Halteria grandinella TaxID=5974 RepID=A0A8J8SZ37_HALGN|nr:hypothetical protein FGO68_gene7319 [Halteria grandinella]